MINKDLEKKIDDIFGRVKTLTKVVIEMAEEKKKILEITKEQQATIIELSSQRALGSNGRNKTLHHCPR
jgi:hypothetical protein